MRQLRERRDLTQDALAQRAGLHSSIVARLERGEREPRLTTIMAIASGLEISLAELFDEL